jgi:hypothetical protein
MPATGTAAAYPPAGSVLDSHRPADEQHAGSEVVAGGSGSRPRHRAIQPLQDQAPAWLPLSSSAVDLLRSLPRTSEYVFTYRGEKIAWTFNTKAFRAARERAGITCRWHDLRHTFASWMAQDGASDRVLQMAGGWTSPRMVAKYAHLRAEELRPSVDAVGTIAVTALQIVLTSPARKRREKLVPEIGIEPTTPSLRMVRSRRKA